VSASASTRTATLSILPLLCVLSIALAASTAVPPSKAGRSTRTIGVNDVKPSACDGITLNGIFTGSGIVSDTGQPHLVLGSSGIDTMRGNDGNDCIIGGGGVDSLRGDNGTDVCIGGPGTDTFHSSCETRIQ
jgi:RTX calcium-binding nonapeptide repeat (4 copies)